MKAYDKRSEKNSSHFTCDFGLSDLFNRYALKKWTFKPVEVDGKPIAALGIAAVDVSWDAAPGQYRSKKLKRGN